MTSIRTRLFFLLTLFGGTTLTLSWVTYSSFKAMMDSRRQLEMSYAIRDEFQELSSLKPGYTGFVIERAGKELRFWPGGAAQPDSLVNPERLLMYTSYLSDVYYRETWQGQPA
ncbi:MAG: hypothetical protein HC883_02880, partial [Bdellovibrionaceae bacterium]|nr:hypothetical protein [Pseudobdellovibrionaceae bacterium]